MSMFCHGRILTHDMYGQYHCDDPTFTETYIHLSVGQMILFLDMTKVLQLSRQFAMQLSLPAFGGGVTDGDG